MAKWAVLTTKGERFGVEAETAGQAAQKAMLKGHTLAAKPVRMDEEQIAVPFVPGQSPDEERAAMRERVMYHVVEIKESMLALFVLGLARISPARMSEVLNRESAQGWRLVFQVTRRQRMLVFFSREVLLMTFEKRWMA